MDRSKSKSSKGATGGAGKNIIQDALSTLKKSLSDNPDGRLDALWGLHSLIQSDGGSSLLKGSPTLISDAHATLITAVPQCPSYALRRLITQSFEVLHGYSQPAFGLPAKAIKTLTGTFSKVAKENRHAVVRVIADIVKCRSFETTSLQNDLLSFVRKNAKESSIPGLQEACLAAFGAFVEAWPAFVPVATPVVLKAVKGVVGDKNVTQEAKTAAAECVGAVNRVYSDLGSQELRIQICVKLMDDKCAQVREAAANALGDLLLKGLAKQVEKGSVSNNNNSKDAGNGDGQQGLDDDIEGKKKKSAMAKNPFGHILSDGFKYLETLFFTTDHLNLTIFRTSITQVYTKLLSALSGGDIDANMDMIVDRMLDLLRHRSASSSSERDPRCASDAYDCVHTVLYAFGSTLREIQQQRMTELLSGALKDRRSDEHILSVVLGEMRCLVAKIGSASADMQEWLTPLVTALLAHPAPSVRFDAALCLRTLGAALPSQLAALIRTCLTAIATHSEGLLINPQINTQTNSQSNPQLNTQKSPKSQSQQQTQPSLGATLKEIGKHAAGLRGYGVALAALISNVDSAPLSVPNSLLRVAFSAARALLALPPHSDSVAQDARVTAAWAIVAALARSRKACDVVHGALKTCVIPAVSAALAGTPYQKQRKPKDVDAFLRGKLGALWVIDAALSNTDTNTTNNNNNNNNNGSNNGQINNNMGSILVTSVLGNLKSLAIELDDLVAACSSGAIPEAGQSGIFMVSAALLRVFAKLPSRDTLGGCHAALYGLSKGLVRDGRAAATVLEKMLNKADDALSFWAEATSSAATSAATSAEKEAGLRCPDYSFVWHPASAAEVREGEVDTALWCGPRAQAVNEAVGVFAQLFALQGEKRQLEMLGELVAAGPEKSAVRRRNGLVAVAAIVRELNASEPRLGERGQVVKALIEQLNRFLADADMSLLRGAAESLGLLCRAAGDAYTGAVVRTLTGLCGDAGTTAHARAGYALALGCIQRAVGIRAARHLEGTLGTLSGALKDGAALLQAVALHAFCLAVDSAPSFKADKAVALVYQLLQSPRHDSAMALRGIGDVVNSLIGIVGPELQRGARLMHVANIVNESLRAYPHPLVQLESLRFYQRLIMFAPQAVAVQEIVPLIRAQMASQWAPVRHDAVTCLRQLVQGAWAAQLGASHLAIAARLFEMLDNESDAGLLAEGELVLATLLEKARPQDATQWLAVLCEIVLTTHSTSKSDGDFSKDGPSSSSSSMSKRGGGDDMGGDDEDDEDEDDDDEDEEGNSFTTGEHQRSYDDEDDVVSGGAINSAMDGNSGNNSGERHEDLSAAAAAAASGAGKPQNELVPRWRTKVFAIKCIHRLLEIVHSKLPETAAHFDSVLAGPTPAEGGGGNGNASGSSGEQGKGGCAYIVHMIAVLVKVVFFAATSTVDPLRPAGVRLMKDIVVYFGAGEDVMARGHKLLELYEAQFASALTRAFSLDVPPETITVACETLAIFILNEITTASSVPRLTLLLAGFVPTLRTIYFPQYSEWAVTQVQTAVVAGLARLTLMRPATSPAIRQAISGGLAPHAAGIKSLFVDYVRDYTALAARLPGVATGEYRATFFAAHDSADALQLMEKDWRLVLSALCRALEASPALPARDHALVLAIALGALPKDPAAVLDVLPALVHRDYLVRAPEEEAEPALAPAKACELVRRVLELDRDGAQGSSPLALAKFAAKLALAIPEDYCSSSSSSSNGDSSDLDKRCELVTLAALLAVRDPPAVDENAAASFATQLQLAGLAFVSLGKIELPDPAAMAAHVGTLLKACLCWAAACPGKNALYTQELSKAVVGLVGRRGAKAPWAAGLVDAALAECLRVAQAACGTPLFATDRSYTALAVFDALVLIACTLRTGAPDEPGFAEATVAGLLAALASPAHSARLAALETLRSVAQLATTAPAAAGAAMQLLYELGPQVARMAAAFAKLGAAAATADDAAEMQEVVKVLVLAHVVAQNKGASIAAVIPSLVVLLAPEAEEGSSANVVHEVAFQAVMQLATKFGNDFRMFVGSLDAERRAHVELMMRKSAEAAAARTRAKAEKVAAAAAAMKQGGGHGRLKPLSLDLSKYKK